jgi:hypothetical protein
VPPPNNTAATAIDLGSLPASLTVDASAYTTSDELWYRHNAVVGEFQLGFAYWTSTITAGAVIAGVFAGVLPDPPSLLNITTSWGALQFPVTAGHTYYLKLSVNVSWPTTPLDLSLVAAPNLATPVGAIAIPDDTDGFPLVIHSPTDGSVLQFRQPFPAGETAAMLPNGRGLFSDSWNNEIGLYDATLTRLRTLAWTVTNGAPPMSTNGVDRFYVGDLGGGAVHARFTTFDADGNPGPTIWTLPEAGLSTLVPAPDETFVYLRGQASAGAQVQRWDLINNVALPNVPITPPTGYTISGLGELVVLPDGTLLVSWHRSSPTYDALVQRLTATGTVITTYPVWTDTEFDHLWLDPDTTSFWAWLHLRSAQDGLSRFERRQVSDGAVLTSVVATQFEGGATEQEPFWTPGSDQFGHSFSCPFVILPYALAPFGGGDGGGGDGPEPPYAAPSYELDARYIRRLRRAPHVSNENVRIFYRKFELDLERGIGLATGPGSDPEVMVRVSRDGGHTWGEPMRMGAGRMGEYTTRVIARRLGQARDTVFEVTVSDPVAWSLVQAWLDLEAGTS